MIHKWIPTAEVRQGDYLACLLSDARAYPMVTGWNDRLLELSRFGLRDVTHRTFTVAGDVPWWVRSDVFQITGDLNGETLIAVREGEGS